jgi:hypothetical protein
VNSNVDQYSYACEYLCTRRYLCMYDGSHSFCYTTVQSLSNPDATVALRHQLMEHLAIPRCQTPRHDLQPVRCSLQDCSDRQAFQPMENFLRVDPAGEERGMEQKRRYAHMHSAASNVHTISVGRLVQHVQKRSKYNHDMDGNIDSLKGKAVEETAKHCGVSKDIS